MDDTVVPCKSLPAASILADRRVILSLVVSNGLYVDLVCRL